MNLYPWKRKTQLRNCPIGLFLMDGVLYFKTGYARGEGKSDVRRVHDGEFLDTIFPGRKYLDMMVIPISKKGMKR